MAGGADATAEAGTVLELSPAALEAVLAARAAEDDAAGLALWVEVSGVERGSYAYEMWFEAPGDAGPHDVVERHGELTVVVPATSAPMLRGARLDVGSHEDGSEGLVLLNPNAPPSASSPSAPAVEVPESDLSGPVAQAILRVLEEEVNPQIALHGGRADLVAYEEGVAYLRMSGGCQGCGLARVTLSQGIAVAIEEAVPEVREVRDVTDHASGTNPYYEPAKK
jgi:Fe/S biogenesis protein NfuA